MPHSIVASHLGMSGLHFDSDLLVARPALPEPDDWLQAQVPGW